MSIPVVLIGKAATIINLRKVWEAQGQGPSAFGRKLCAINPAATYETPATAYLMSDAGVANDLVTAWQQMPNGNLPQIEGVWGVDGVVSAADAMEATNADNLHVYTASGDISPPDHANAVIASEGYQYVPDEPL